MKVHVLYPGRTEDSTQEIVLTKRVLVVNPIALAALLISVSVAITFWVMRRRRKRRRAVAEQPRASDRPAATATPASAPPIMGVVASSVPPSGPPVQPLIITADSRPAPSVTRPTERVIDLASGRVADRAATADGSDLPAFLLRQLRERGYDVAMQDLANGVDHQPLRPRKPEEQRATEPQLRRCDNCHAAGKCFYYKGMWLCKTSMNTCWRNRESLHEGDLTLRSRTRRATQP